MIFQKNRNKLIEKAWGFEQDIIIEQIFEYANKLGAQTLMKSISIDFVDWNMKTASGSYIF